MIQRGKATKTSTNLDSRGVTPVLGLILLIGVVAIASIGILVVGTDLMTEQEQQVEHERVEQGFVQLAQTMESASNSDTAHEMQLDAGESGAIAREDAGQITVEADGLEDPIDFTFGTIEYVSDDGTRIAYEAGGVFRETGNETRIVSTPPVHYDSESNTFSFPMTTIQGDERLGSGGIAFNHKTTNVYPETNAITAPHITLTIQSKYYRGWEKYFEQQAGRDAIRDLDHETQTVTVRLGHIELEEAFDSGISVSEPVGEQGNVDYDDTDASVREGSMPEMDVTISELVDVVNTSDNRSWATTEGDLVMDGSNHEEPLTSGSYFAEGVELENSDSDLEFDLSSGNATLVVDGDIIINDGGATISAKNWRVPDGTDHTLRIYSTGNFHMKDGTVAAEPDGGESYAQQIQVYGTSQMSIGFEKGFFKGIIYAPSSDFDGYTLNVGSSHCESYHQACFHSNPDFEGALITSSVNFQGGNGNTFKYDTSLEDSNIEVYPDGYTPPPQLTYLHIVRNTIDVTNK